jgi:hypothetical protein
MEELQFSIVAHNGNRFDLTIPKLLAKQNTGTYYWIDVTVISSGLQGTLRTDVEVRQFHSFLQELQECYGDLNGKAQLENLRERDFTVEVEFCESGAAKVAASIERNEYQSMPVRNTLYAEFESDQTFLKQTIDQLRSLMRRL